MKKSVRVLTECAVMLAVANVLSFIKLPSFWAYGGGITVVSMLPLVLICFRHGTKTGLLAAFAYSCMQLIFGLDNVQYATGFVMAAGIVLFDYILAYSAIGLAACFNKSAEGKPADLSLCVGIAFAFALRLACHFISGWWIWEALWPNELAWAAPIWSLTYNASYMVPEIVLTCIAACLLNRTTRLFVRI